MISREKTELLQVFLHIERGMMLICSVSSLSSESVTEVRTNIYVTSFGPVSDTDMVSMSLFSFLLTLISIMSHQI